MVERYRNTPFAWGTADCACFLADCAQAITGDDHLGKLRGSYRTKAGAARVLARLNCADLGDALAMKFPEVPPALAQRGDLGVAPVEGGGLAGCLFLGHDVMGMGANSGLLRLPRSVATRAFRV